MHPYALHAFSPSPSLVFSSWEPMHRATPTHANKDELCWLDKPVGRILLVITTAPLRKNSSERRVSEIPRLGANLRTNAADGRTPDSLLDFPTRSRIIRCPWFPVIFLVAELYFFLFYANLRGGIRRKIFFNGTSDTYTWAAIIFHGNLFSTMNLSALTRSVLPKGRIQGRAFDWRL